MFKLLKYFKWFDWLALVAVFGLTIAEVHCDLKLPEYMVNILSSIGAGTGEVWKQGGMIMLYVSISVVISIVISYISSIISSGFSKRLRKQIFNKVGEFSMSEINKFSTASLITRSTNDVVQVKQVLMMMMRMFMYAPVMAVYALLKITSINSTLTWTTFGFVMLMFVFVATIMALVIRKFILMQKQTDELNGVARENLTGIRVVRANNAEKYQEAKFKRVNDKLTSTTLYVNRVTSFMFPGMQLIMNGLNLALYWIGANFISNPQEFLQVSEFSQYAVHVLMSFLLVSALFVMIPRASVSAKRINEVLDTVASIKSGELKPEKTESVGTVEFKNVSFKYPGAEEYVLKDVSFSAKQGETVAFIGSTGSGKSTLINLVARFYDATEGSVLIDGINIKDYKFSALNDRLGYIPQKSYLFAGTIAENVAYGVPEATEEQIYDALETAQAKDFVEELGGKLDFFVSQGGKNLSGGQRQRISIARAIIKNPEILIFDDSFSALDYQTDRALRSELSKKCKDATKLIVAQRIGTILDADKIIVLDEGKVVGEGTHKQLMKNCEVYRQIALSQLSEEELKNGRK